ncbi:hypothetical protein MPSEU_000220100 [Mayamaea pseudoterrestris]|nr:hypothetical protein MPSEU_000220100 [Mayamaea pseudoterrestris]
MMSDSSTKKSRGSQSGINNIVNCLILGLAIALQTAEASVSTSTSTTAAAAAAAATEYPRRVRSSRMEKSKRCAEAIADEHARPVARWAQKKQHHDAFVQGIMTEMNDRSNDLRCEIRDRFTRMRQLLDDDEEEEEEELHEELQEAIKETDNLAVEGMNMDAIVEPALPIAYVSDETAAAAADGQEQGLEKVMAVSSEALSPQLTQEDVLHDLQMIERKHDEPQKSEYFEEQEQLEDSLTTGPVITEEPMEANDSSSPLVSYSTISVDSQTPHEWLELGESWLGDARHHDDTSHNVVDLDDANDPGAFYSHSTTDLNVPPDCDLNVNESVLKSNEMEPMLRGGQTFAVDADAAQTATTETKTGDEDYASNAKPVGNFWKMGETIELQAMQQQQQQLLPMRLKRRKHNSSQWKSRRALYHGSAFIRARNEQLSKAFNYDNDDDASRSKSQALILGVSGGGFAKSSPTGRAIQETLTKVCMFTLFGALFALIMQLVSRLM